MPSQVTKPAHDSRSSKAGITTDENGIRHIPASVRADGSIRKEIRIKPGYRPPEDVEVYKNRTAEAWKNRGQGGVPGADAADSHTISPNSAAANKNSKRREARKKAAAESKNDVTTTKSGNGTHDTSTPDITPAATVLDPEVEKEKQVKKLAKKVRQARELKDKKDAGSSLLPEQAEKVIRINELVRQLDQLGFNANGDKKPSS